jgi:hypothetical protein
LNSSRQEFEVVHRQLQIERGKRKATQGGGIGFLAALGEVRDYAYLIILRRSDYVKCFRSDSSLVIESVHENCGGIAVSRLTKKEGSRPY